MCEVSSCPWPIFTPRTVDVNDYRDGDYRGMGHRLQGHRLRNQWLCSWWLHWNYQQSWSDLLVTDKGIPQSTTIRHYLFHCDCLLCMQLHVRAIIGSNGTQQLTGIFGMILLLLVPGTCSLEVCMDTFRCLLWVGPKTLSSFCAKLPNMVKHHMNLWSYG